MRHFGDRRVDADGVLGHALDRSSQCQCSSWSAGEVAKVEGRVVADTVR
jgi:hypothetical protein